MCASFGMHISSDVIWWSSQSFFFFHLRSQSPVSLKGEKATPLKLSLLAGCMQAEDQCSQGFMSSFRQVYIPSFAFQELQIVAL
jgi:hypothetical protein